MDKKRTPSTNKPSISVTLGTNDADIKRRKDGLDRIAKAYGVNRSRLLQMIGDGNLEVIPRAVRQEQAS